MQQYLKNPTGLERPNGYYELNSGNNRLTDESINKIQEIIWKVVSQHPQSGIDISPNILNFKDQSNISPATEIISDAIEVTGINAETEIWISGGEYAINNGDYTGLSGYVNNNDTVTIRAISPPTFGLTKRIVLTIGDISSTFEITTGDNVSAVDSNNGKRSVGCSLNNKTNYNDIDLSPLMLLMMSFISIVIKSKDK